MKKRITTTSAVSLARRIADDYGQGHFGAPRGSRTHNGQDYCCEPGEEILAPATGKVIKLGFPYADDLAYRYVRIRTESGDEHTIMYVEPSRDIPLGGEVIAEETVIGHAQDLTTRYPGDGNRRPIKNHVHYGIWRDGSYVDPAEK